jgi:hypothetical protein
VCDGERVAARARVANEWIMATFLEMGLAKLHGEVLDTCLEFVVDDFSVGSGVAHDPFLGRCSCSVETEERPRDGETSFPHGERKTNGKNVIQRE